MQLKLARSMWFYLYGVPYCTACVNGKSQATRYTHCMSSEERKRAVRDRVPVGGRCHCCGRAAR